MRKNEKILVIAAICFIVPFASFGLDSSEADSLTKFFPDIKDWVKDGKPEIYHSDNLWEYINGAADLYLSYDFEKVATLTYDGDRKRSLTIDIYKHSSPRNAFGIYSQERPDESTLLPIGTQGYYEKGILNFFRGSYYVKLMGFYLGEDEKLLLISAAEEIATWIDGEAIFPKVLDCFPEKGKVENSERYIAKDFLGRDFLHSAFIAEYEMDGERKRIFIIEAEDESEAEGMLEKYLKVVEEKGSRITHEEGLYRFEDPYLHSNGLMNLKSKGKYIWGLFSQDALEAENYINRIEENLAKNSMIELM